MWPYTIHLISFSLLAHISNGVCNIYLTGLLERSEAMSAKGSLQAHQTKAQTTKLQDNEA
jgi:hypothetical protein